MNELIRVEIEKIKAEIKTRKSDISISDDRAFSYVLLDNFFDVHDFGDQTDLVTDGANDGGIDFCIMMKMNQELYCAKRNVHLIYRIKKLGMNLIK